MKRILNPTALIALFAMLNSCRLSAQDFTDPVQYIDYIGKANESLTQKYLVYLSFMSHGKNARKVEKRRTELLNAISDTRFSIQGMPPFKGDRSFRDTTVTYLKILNSVFNEDYGKIVNMEDIAEQSYDLMEAYMLAKEKANEKLEEASQRQHEAQRKFAGAHNINLIENENEMGAKMKIADEVMKHYQEVYLIFFKSDKQEAYLMDAVNNKNINAVEQNLNSLQSFSEEGLAKLKELKAYNNDPSLIVSCRSMLNFYLSEIKRMNIMTDFFLKQENFAKLKKKFDASKKTQKDVDAFNEAVNDINAAGKTYNETNADLNKERNSNLDDWNRSVKKYMDAYMPYQQRG